MVPDDLYARWLVLKKQYMGSSKSVEKNRPIFAIQKLFDKALNKSGLTRNTGITKKLRKVAKRNKIELVQPEIVVELDQPKSALKKFKKTEINDLECFTKTMERIETDLSDMQLRAVAWSYGDIDTIKALPYVDDIQACTAVLLNSELAKDVGMTDIRSRLRAVWFDAAKTSLINNKTTFAVLPMAQLLNEGNILNDFASAGFTIEAPNTGIMK